MSITSSQAYLSELLVNWVGNKALDSLFDEPRKNPQIFCVPSLTIFSLGALLFAISAAINIANHVLDENKRLKQENCKLKHNNSLKNKRISKHRKTLTEKDAIFSANKTALDVANKTISGLKLENNELKRKVVGFETRTNVGLMPQLVNNDLNQIKNELYSIRTLASTGLAHNLRMAESSVNSAYALHMLHKEHKQ